MTNTPNKPMLYSDRLQRSDYEPDGLVQRLYTSEAPVIVEYRQYETTTKRFETISMAALMLLVSGFSVIDHMNTGKSSLVIIFSILVMVLSYAGRPIIKWPNGLIYFVALLIDGLLWTILGPLAALFLFGQVVTSLIVLFWALIVAARRSGQELKLYGIAMDAAVDERVTEYGASLQAERDALEQRLGSN